MLRWSFRTARFIAVSLLLFLLIGSQCILRVRNFTTSIRPLSAALWSGQGLLVWNLYRLAVRNFTTAQWRGVSCIHPDMMDCNLAHLSNTWLCADIHTHSEEEFDHAHNVWVTALIRDEILNYIEAAPHAALWRGVLFQLFLRSLMSLLMGRYLSLSEVASSKKEDWGCLLYISY